MNPGAGIILWIIVGASAGWLASRITGTDGRRGALANVFIGVLGALVAGVITQAVLAGLGYQNLAISGVAGALFGACAVVSGLIDMPAASARRDLHIPMTTILKLIASGLGLWAAWLLWPEFLLFLIAILLAVTLHPAVAWIERRRIARGVSVMVIAAFAFALSRRLRVCSSEANAASTAVGSALNTPPSSPPTSGDGSASVHLLTPTTTWSPRSMRAMRCAIDRTSSRLQ